MNSVLITSVICIVILAIIIAYVAYVVLLTPKYNGQLNMVEKEGFFGGVARGSGHPDCLRTLQGSAEIMNKVAAATGTPDYTEMQIILSKLACLKKDLMSPSGIVEATRYQPYETAHDREPVAEVTAQCISQTIPIRDLDIIFQTWRDRGMKLLRRLCTIAALSESDVQTVEKLFGDSWTDVYEIAKGRCIATVGQRDAIGREEQPYMPPALENARAYDGYYSGWGGQI
jgi:hypothetical protein